MHALEGIGFLVLFASMFYTGVRLIDQHIEPQLRSLRQQRVSMAEAYVAQARDNQRQHARRSKIG